VSLLVVERLSKAFDGFQAVNDVSFTIERGEFSAVIGPNGAGKTTLFNLLTGHLTKTTGRVVFDGVDITHRAPHEIVRLGIGRAFQRASIFPVMSVLENVHAALLAHRGRHRGVVVPARRDTAGRDRAREILRWVHLDDVRDAPAGSLSHGDQKLLDIAVALALEPKLLLLDEPTAGMHPEERRETMRLVQRLWSDLDMTVVFVEHDMDIVFGVAGTIRVLHHGELVAQGPPAEISANQLVIEAYLGEGVL
jgi:branched-chain amino acid transport system ATP-binding protein